VAGALFASEKPADGNTNQSKYDQYEGKNNC
jgi:hypothetical protein